MNNPNDDRLDCTKILHNFRKNITEGKVLVDQQGKELEEDSEVMQFVYKALSMRPGQKLGKNEKLVVLHRPPLTQDPVISYESYKNSDKTRRAQEAIDTYKYNVATEILINLINEYAPSKNPLILMDIYSSLASIFILTHDYSNAIECKIDAGDCYKRLDDKYREIAIIDTKKVYCFCEALAIEHLLEDLNLKLQNLPPKYNLEYELKPDWKPAPDLENNTGVGLKVTEVADDNPGNIIPHRWYYDMIYRHGTQFIYTKGDVSEPVAPIIRRVFQLVSPENYLSTDYYLFCKAYINKYQQIEEENDNIITLAERLIKWSRLYIFKTNIVDEITVRSALVHRLVQSDRSDTAAELALESLTFLSLNSDIQEIRDNLMHLFKSLWVAMSVLDKLGRLNECNASIELIIDMLYFVDDKNNMGYIAIIEKFMLLLNEFGMIEHRNRLAQTAIELWERLGVEDELYRSMENIAGWYIVNQPSQAIEYYDRLIAYYSKILPRRSHDLGCLYNNRAQAYCAKKEYVKGLENYLDAYKLCYPATIKAQQELITITADLGVLCRELEMEGVFKKTVLEYLELNKPRNIDSPEYVNILKILAASDV